MWSMGTWARTGACAHGYTCTTQPSTHTQSTAGEEESETYTGRPEKSRHGPDESQGAQVGKGSSRHTHTITDADSHRVQQRHKPRRKTPHIHTNTPPETENTDQLMGIQSETQGKEDCSKTGVSGQVCRAVKGRSTGTDAGCLWDPGLGAATENPQPGGQGAYPQELLPPPLPQHRAEQEVRGHSTWSSRVSQPWVPGQAQKGRSQWS